MLTINAFTLLFNGLTLALASGFLLIILWYDSQKILNQFFSLFLFFVIVWNVGSLLLQVAIFAVDVQPLIDIAVSMIELGFTGSSLGMYILATIFVSTYTPRFRWLALSSLLVVVAYRILLIVTGVTVSTTVDVANIDTLLVYQFSPMFVIFYLTFDGLTMFLMWRYRRKIRSRMLRIGVILFLIGQTFTFVNPTLAVASFSTTISSLGVLIMSAAIIRQEIIMPLAERVTQVEAMHKVSLAMTSQIAIDTVLNEIAVQAAGWLEADGVGIFLKKKQTETLKLANVHNLPEDFLDVEIPIGKGLAGTAAGAQKTIFLENYWFYRNWWKRGG